VFVVEGDVADAGVQPDGVLLGAHALVFGVQPGWVADLLQVRPLALDVAEQGLDQAWPCGVCRRPNCWAIATPARNSRVLTDFICRPLSLMASSKGSWPSALRNLVISILQLAGHTAIAAALRHAARDPARVFRLLTGRK